MKRLEDICLGESDTLHQAIAAMDKGAIRVVLVNDASNRLVGVVTDGDIRRGLLKGLGLDSPVAEVMHTEFKSLPEGSTREQALELMYRFKVQHIPCVDEGGQVTHVFVRDQVDQLVKRPNWVVLMAGGEGKRLRPHTETMPKPMLVVGGRPILAHILEGCIEAGFNRIFISVNYLRHEIMDYFGDGHAWGIEIEYLVEQEPLGTAGSLALLPEVPTDPVLVMNADVLNRLDFSNLLDFHERAGADATICIRQFDLEIPFGVVNVEDSQVISMQEKPLVSRNVNTGIYVVSPELLGQVPKDQPSDMPDLLTAALTSGSTVSAFPIHEYWLDVGHIKALEQARGEWV